MALRSAVLLACLLGCSSGGQADGGVDVVDASYADTTSEATSDGSGDGGAEGASCSPSQTQNDRHLIRETLYTVQPMAVDANAFYVIGYGTIANNYNDAIVQRVSRDGSTLDTLVGPTPAPRGITTDGKNVYWTNQAGNVLRCAVTGCSNTPTPLVGLQVGLGPIATDGVNVYYGTSTGIAACSVTGCSAPTMLAPAPLGGVRDVVTDGKSVYWSAGTNGGTSDGAIRSCAVTGCSQTPTVLALNETDAVLFTDGKTLFWTASGSGAKSCSVSGCSGVPTLLARNANNAPIEATYFDGTTVYWSVGGSILSCPATGCGGSPIELSPVIDGDPPSAGGPPSIATTITSSLDGLSFEWLTQMGQSNGTFLGDGTLLGCPLCGCYGAPKLEWPGGTGTDLDASGSTLVWITPPDGTGQSHIMTCDLDHCGDSIATVFTTASNVPAPQHLRTDGTRVYWHDANGSPTFSNVAVRSCPIVGCVSPATIAPNQGYVMSDLAMDATNVYWMSAGVLDGGTPKPSLWTVAKAGGTVSAIGSPLNDTWPASHSLVVASGYAYWASAGDGIVAREPIGGGTVELLANGQGYPGSLVVDSTSAYWYAGGVVKLDLGSTTPQVLATGPTLGALNQRMMVLNGSAIYWLVSSAGGWFDGSLNRVSTSGGTVTVRAASQYGISSGNKSSIASTPGRVVWSNSTFVKSVTVP